MDESAFFDRKFSTGSSKNWAASWQSFCWLQHLCGSAMGKGMLQGSSFSGSRQCWGRETWDMGEDVWGINAGGRGREEVVKALLKRQLDKKSCLLGSWWKKLFLTELPGVAAGDKTSCTKPSAASFSKYMKRCHCSPKPRQICRHRPLGCAEISHWGQGEELSGEGHNYTGLSRAELAGSLSWPQWVELPHQIMEVSGVATPPPWSGGWERTIGVCAAVEGGVCGLEQEILPASCWLHQWANPCVTQAWSGQREEAVYSWGSFFRTWQICSHPWSRGYTGSMKV